MLIGLTIHNFKRFGEAEIVRVAQSTRCSQDSRLPTPSPEAVSVPSAETPEPLPALDTLDVDEENLYEEFCARGWTDGLPVVAPTEERVAALLERAVLSPDAVLGEIPHLRRSLTARASAANAVMAGCAPMHFPLAVAALRAMLDPAFNAHTVMSSTGGAAFCLLVSGPITVELEMATRNDALGIGARSNAVVGRTLRLVARNVFDARAGHLDGSSIGHPGKFTMCLAEDAPPTPWRTLNCELGYDEEDSTVTILGTEAPRQVANLLNPSPEGILLTMASAMRLPATFPVGKGGQGVVVLGPEHAALLVDAGWSRSDVREFLAEASRVDPSELQAAGVIIEEGSQHDMRPGVDGRLPAVRSPKDIFLVTAGGHGAGWSAYIPAWAPLQHSMATTWLVTPR